MTFISHRSAVAVTVLIGALALCGQAFAETCAKPDTLDQHNIVSLHIINVGQGDALAVTCHDGSIGLLVDSGDNRPAEKAGQERMKAYLSGLIEKSPKKNTVPLFVVTHPDSDHIGNGVWVLTTFKVKTFLDDGRKSTSKTYKSLHALAEKQAAAGTLTYLSAGTAARKFPVCPGVDAEITTPPDYFSSCKDNNDCSIVLKVTDGKVSFLLTGDAGKRQENVLLHDKRADQMLPSTVLKVGHHGAETSSSPDFIERVKPACAVISSGKPNEGGNKKYNHPRLPVVKTLLENTTLDRQNPATIAAYGGQSVGFKKLMVEKCLYHTATDGNVIFSTDGKKLACEAR